MQVVGNQSEPAVPASIVARRVTPVGNSSCPTLQHNQPAAVAVAPVVSRLPVPHIVPARLLSVLLTNPRSISVSAISLRFRISAGKIIPPAMAKPARTLKTATLPSRSPAVVGFLVSLYRGGGGQNGSHNFNSGLFSTQMNRRKTTGGSNGIIAHIAPISKTPAYPQPSFRPHTAILPPNRHSGASRNPTSNPKSPFIPSIHAIKNPVLPILPIGVKKPTSNPLDKNLSSLLPSPCRVRISKPPPPPHSTPPQNGNHPSLPGASPSKRPVVHGQSATQVAPAFPTRPRSN